MIFDYKVDVALNYQYQTYTDEQCTQIKAQADAVVRRFRRSILQGVTKAAHCTTTAHTLIQIRKTDDSDKKSDDTESTESSESSDTDMYTLQTIFDKRAL